MTRSGDRAEDVARALLLTIAAGMRTLTGDPLGHVVITSADLRHLLGITTRGPRTVELPGTIRVVDDLERRPRRPRGRPRPPGPPPGRTIRSRPPWC